MVTNSVWSRTDQVFDDYKLCKGSAIIETFLSGYNITTEPLSLTLDSGAKRNRLRKADLNILSKLGNQGLEWRLEPEAFTGDEVGGEDDLLDFLVGRPVDIQLARQPST